MGFESQPGGGGAKGYSQATLGHQRAETLGGPHTAAVLFAPDFHFVSSSRSKL